MTNYKLSVRAENDLKGIYRYTVTNFGRPQAVKYLLELQSVFELIGDQPRIGRVFKGRTRQFVHGKHIIMYRIQQNGVFISRIFHGAQRRGV